MQEGTLKVSACWA